MVYRKILLYNLILFLLVISGCSSKNANSLENESNLKYEMSKANSTLDFSNNSSSKIKEISDVKKTQKISESTKSVESQTPETSETTTPSETESVPPTQKTTSSETTAEVEPQKKLEFIKSYTTDFDASKTNRVSNIKLASQKINGVIIEPEEIFSFNQTVGSMGPEQGFKKAVIFVDGKETEDYGGGICQISTTIFNAIESLGVEVVEQHHHSHEVPYAEKGKDASISYGSEDFKFKNINSYPLQINTKVKKNTLTVSISKVKYE